MRRVDIAYGGMHYSLPRTTVEAVKKTIEEGLAGTGPRWMTVNFGEGKPQPVEILISPNIPIALAQVSTEDNERPETHRDEMGSLDAHSGSVPAHDVDL
ncbi:hypothetical protein ACUWEX_13310 [Okibacterium fritillariae]|uniref:Uncharacterized protein n=1 Tax=Okibacterium fritillariae TaxID=123320 RepID=A0A1T5KXZ2_9MICO|nr:hypothetical protein [Okibacterium fritillariae]SKC68335.1 hypothetical protein SAMN06309945_2622 [Okibacterium fritillariae]